MHLTMKSCFCGQKEIDMNRIKYLKVWMKMSPDPGQKKNLVKRINVVVVVIFN